MKNKNLFLLGLILFSLFAILLYFVTLKGALYWDEVVYLANARDHISQSYYTEDFRFPLLSAVIAGVWVFTGESVLIAQLIAILTSLLTIALFYFIARYFLEDKFAILASFLLAFSLQFINWGFRIYTDMLGVCLILASLLYFLKDYYKKIDINKTEVESSVYFNKWRLWYSNNLVIFAGLFAGFAFLARLSTIIIAIALGIFFLLRKNWFKQSLKFAFGFTLALLPWLIEGMIKTGNPLSFALKQTSAILEYTLRESPRFFIKFLFNEYGLASFFILGIGFYFFKVERRTKKIKFTLSEYNQKILLLIFILIIQLIFYMFFVKLKLARYLLELSPFIILLIVLGVQAIYMLIVNYEKKYNVVISLILLLILIASILIPSMLNTRLLVAELKCTSTGALHQSINFIQEVSQPGQTIISSIWPYYGYYANVRAFSPWSEDLGDFFSSYDPAFFIFSDKVGIPFTGILNRTDVVEVASFSDNCGWDLKVYQVR